MPWTEEQTARLKELAGLGWSFREIAADVGMSRNACIAKADRMGIDNGVAPQGKGERRSTKAPRIAPKRQWRKRQNDGVIAPPMPLVTVRKNEPAPIGPVRDFVAGGCKFIHGEVKTGADWRCCGHPAIRHDIPWCQFHLKVIGASKRERPEEEDTAELASIAKDFLAREAAE